MKKKMATPAGCLPYPTAKEQKEERQRIRAELKRMAMTKKKYSEKCKEIMASTELNVKGKAEALEHAATLYVEDNIGRFPEIRSIEKRRTAIEEKYSGYCQVCGSWSPKEPPAIVSLDREWGEAKDRKIAELCRKVLARKAA
jgi:hypothetical protein